MDQRDAKAIGVFTGYLKTKGLKLTQQRSIILHKVLSTHKHFAAEELLAALKRQHKGISKATVYRTLALLEEANLLNAIDFKFGYRMYEHTQLAGHEHHEHIVCVECAKVVEFADAELETFHDRIAEQFGFEVVSHTYKIFGLCPACRGAGEQDHKALARTSITR